MTLNAAPNAVLHGIEDVSGRRVDPAPVQLPIHLPHVPILAQRGPAEAQILSPSDAQRIYGDVSFDYRKPYAKHTTALAKECLFPNANSAVFQRLIPTDATRAAMGIGLDVIEKQLDEYERNPDGSFVLDPQGKKIPTGTKVKGHVGKWVIYDIAEKDVGKTKPKQGTMQDGAKQSMLYPMFELVVSHHGKYGNNVGLRMWAPTVNDASPLNEYIVNETRAYLYRLAFLERADDRSTPLPLRGLMDQTYVDFGLKPDMYYEPLRMGLHANEVVIPGYRDTDRSKGIAPEYGPFKTFKVYQDNVDLITNLVFAEEKAAQGWTDDDTYMVNLLSAQDENGNGYHTFELLDIFDGGINLNDQATFYAKDGHDGDLSDTAFDELCYTEFNNFGTQFNEFLDIARFPQSVVYDSGFSVKTKKAMTKIIGARKDIWIALATQDVSLPQNNAEAESSMAVALRTQCEMQPEAELYGTSVVRAAIIGHSGYLINSEYKKLVPGTFEIAYMLAAWAGAGDGKLKGRFSPDVDPMNKVKLLRDVNCTWKGSRVRNKDWDNGLVWCQSYDHMSLFFPGMQTVYKDDTSILNSLLNMIICVEVQKVCFRVWRKFTGRSNMSNLQYEQASDREITAQTTGRFDERVVIVPETFHSARNVQQGYANSARVHVYGNNMKTVSEFTVVAHRIEELAA